MATGNPPASNECMDQAAMQARVTAGEFDTIGCMALIDHGAGYVWNVADFKNSIIYDGTISRSNAELLPYGEMQAVAVNAPCGVSPLNFTALGQTDATSCDPNGNAWIDVSWDNPTTAETYWDVVIEQADKAGAVSCPTSGWAVVETIACAGPSTSQTRRYTVPNGADYCYRARYRFQSTDASGKTTNTYGDMVQDTAYATCKTGGPGGTT